MLGLRLVISALLFASAYGGIAQTTDPAPDLATRIDELLNRPAARRTSWGVLVRDLATGTTVYEHNPDKLFVPASNVKLFSTALALTRLGPDYTFTTVVLAEGGITEQGSLQGDVRVVGGGDPNFSARILPYRNQEVFGADRLEPVRRLAREMRAAGIQRITGDVIGDDSRYVWQPYPVGWSYKDTLQSYGSPISALVFNDNVVEALVSPGLAGGPARLQLRPALPVFDISNQSVTAAGRQVVRGLAARRGQETGEIVLSGQIPSQSRGRTFRFAADDPARYSALALHQALKEVGIEVEGGARAHHLLPDGLRSLRSRPSSRQPASGQRIAELTSVELQEVVRVVNKVSQNLHAEILMREVALQESGIGSQESSVASMRRFLAEAGLRSDEFFLRDGSGLSRHNLLAPTATVRLLEFMWNSEHRKIYLESLPIAGYDGTLDWRFRRTAARGRIRAKTGSMSHVLALSGYAEAAGGSTYAFSIYANNYGMSSSSTRYLADAIATALVVPSQN